jgi:hypothetical protein
MIDEAAGVDRPCDMCGAANPDDCVCPECPVCQTLGDPKCYQHHGLRLNKKQVAGRAQLHVNQCVMYLEDATQGADYMEEEYTANVAEWEMRGKQGPRPKAPTAKERKLNARAKRIADLRLAKAVRGLAKAEKYRDTYTRAYDGDIWVRK